MPSYQIRICAVPAWANSAERERGERERDSDSVRVCEREREGGERGERETVTV